MSWEVQKCLKRSFHTIDPLTKSKNALILFLPYTPFDQGVSKFNWPYLPKYLPYLPQILTSYRTHLVLFVWHIYQWRYGYSEVCTLWTKYPPPPSWNWDPPLLVAPGGQSWNWAPPPPPFGHSRYGCAWYAIEILIAFLFIDDFDGQTWLSAPEICTVKIERPPRVQGQTSIYVYFKVVLA